MGNEIVKSASAEDDDPRDAPRSIQKDQSNTNSFTQFFLGGNGDILNCENVTADDIDGESSSDLGVQHMSSRAIESEENRYSLDEIEIVASESMDEVYLLSAAVSSEPDDLEDLPQRIPFERERINHSPQRLESETFFDALDSREPDVSQPELLKPTNVDLERFNYSTADTHGSDISVKTSLSDQQLPCYISQPELLKPKLLSPQSGQVAFLPFLSITDPKSVPNDMKNIDGQVTRTNLVDTKNSDLRMKRTIQTLKSIYSLPNDTSPQKHLISIIKWQQMLSQTRHTREQYRINFLLCSSNYHTWVLDRNHYASNSIKIGMSLKHNGSDLTPTDDSSRNTVKNSFDLDSFFNHDYIQESEQVLRNKVTIPNQLNVVQTLLNIADCDIKFFSNLITNIVAFSSLPEISIDNDDKAVTYSVSLKNEADVLAKARCKYNGDILRVKDVLRGYIIFLDERAVFRALLYLRTHSTEDFHVVRVKNLFRTYFDGSLCPSNLPTGYRHILVNVRLKSGLLAEIQLQLKVMFDVMGFQGYKLHKLVTALNNVVIVE